MDSAPEHEGNEEKNDTERVVLVSAHTTNEEINAIPAAGHEKEDEVEVLTSDHDEEDSPESLKAIEGPPAEEVFTSETEEYSGHELSAVDRDGDVDVKINKVSEESVVFEINSNDDDEPPRLYLDTPETNRTAHDDEEETKEKAPAATPAHKEDINYEEHLQELSEERDRASQHNNQLQMKLAEYFRKKAVDDSQLEREMPVSEQLREYEKYINILSDLKQQISTESQTSQQQVEVLRLQSQEKLDQVGVVELWLDF